MSVYSLTYFSLSPHLQENSSQYHTTRCRTLRLQFLRATADTQIQSTARSAIPSAMPEATRTPMASSPSSSYHPEVFSLFYHPEGFFSSST